MHVIVGAFLHDIGHLLGIERHMERMTSHGLPGHKDGKINWPYNHVLLNWNFDIPSKISQIYIYHMIGTTLGTRTHEKVGEKFLKNLGFPESVTNFVRGHVDAKRYLVYRYELIISTLSNLMNIFRVRFKESLLFKARLLLSR